MACAARAVRCTHTCKLSYLWSMRGTCCQRSQYHHNVHGRIPWGSCRRCSKANHFMSELATEAAAAAAAAAHAMNERFLTAVQGVSWDSNRLQATLSQFISHIRRCMSKPKDQRLQQAHTYTHKHKLGTYVCIRGSLYISCSSQPSHKP